MTEGSGVGRRDGGEVGGVGVGGGEVGGGEVGGVGAGGSAARVNGGDHESEKDDENGGVMSPKVPAVAQKPLGNYPNGRTQQVSSGVSTVGQVAYASHAGTGEKGHVRTDVQRVRPMPGEDQRQSSGIVDGSDSEVWSGIKRQVARKPVPGR